MRPARAARLAPVALALAAGLLQAWSVAWPWGLELAPWLRRGEPAGWLQVASLAAAVALLARSPDARALLLRALVFATAWLAGVFAWLFTSMHVYGGMAAPLAATAVLLLALFLALDYALAAWLWWRARPAAPWAAALAFAAAWTLAELARGVLWTGFPWGAGGYAQVDVLGALAPWMGVYGLGALAALAAAWLALARGAAWLAGAALVLALWGWPGAGAWLHARLPQPTQPAGTLPVRLLQGAIPQDEKFDAERGIERALRWYGQALVRAAQTPSLAGGLVVAPETAIPLLPQDVPADYWAQLAAAIRQGHAAVLMGLPLGSLADGYTNSVVGWRPGAAPQDAAHAPARADYRYDKHHLVPFGEFVPPGFRWFVNLMVMPMGDFARGALPQPALEWGGQRIAPHVCYEDLFGEELAAAFREPTQAPTVLVNVSNIAWFGDGVAIDQHRGIARLRALELGRPMLRATNTGATAAIDHRGRVLAELPRGVPGELDAVVQGRQGLTPYARWAARWGLAPVAAAALLLWALALAAGGRRRMGP
ncbi:Apolipoprotein N-acyltransferase [Tepidimonas alkaliphilus]|uniref:Apolipoprotein N-acyltransferase n=1 Tax=Tepidimonas alkaliphilus TaxID=2588942 RepID=A0A554WBA2_9BURK|nr:apolipoprotein N-acyltransferase [Tepidimonas alkaliphilus]TSE20857.1 Apolipoprotein N-acyltransferase [Tepidimonas alkaliphilus]